MAYFIELLINGALTGLIGGPLLIWLLPRLRGSTPPGTEKGEGPAPRRARPGRVLANIKVPFPRPRSRSYPGYGEMTEKIFALLEQSAA